MKPIVADRCRLDVKAECGAGARMNRRIHAKPPSVRPMDEVGTRSGAWLRTALSGASVFGPRAASTDAIFQFPPLFPASLLRRADLIAMDSPPSARTPPLSCMWRTARQAGLEPRPGGHPEPRRASAGERPSVNHFFFFRTCLRCAKGATSIAPSATRPRRFVASGVASRPGERPNTTGAAAPRAVPLFPTGTSRSTRHQPSGAGSRPALEGVFQAILRVKTSSRPPFFVQPADYIRANRWCAEDNPGILDFQDAVHGDQLDVASLSATFLHQWDEGRGARRDIRYWEEARKGGLLPVRADFAISGRDVDWMGRSGPESREFRFAARSRIATARRATCRTRRASSPTSGPRRGDSTRACNPWAALLDDLEARAELRRSF